MRGLIFLFSGGFNGGRRNARRGGQLDPRRFRQLAHLLLLALAFLLLAALRLLLAADLHGVVRVHVLHARLVVVCVRVRVFVVLRDVLELFVAELAVEWT